jgi:putative hydrolase of the HAD superfamily
MIIVFDLDDTLYNEIDFVKSGFLEVSKYLDKKNYIKIYNKMLEIFETEGSGKIFNKILDKNNSTVNIQKLINIYRFHRPNISLSEQNRILLENLSQDKNIKLSLISDSDYLMQKNKFLALKLDKYIKNPIFTDFYQTHKPEEKAFKIVMQEFGLNNNFYYIADNPKKDFLAPNNLQWTTIRYKNKLGIYKNIENTADFEISNLTEIKNIFDKMKIKKS